MAAKRISISLDAYRHLQRLKRGEESFSDVILRLTGRGDLLRFAGSISPEFAQELRAASASLRERFDSEGRGRTR